MSWYDPTGITDSAIDAVTGSAYDNPANAAQPYLDKIPGYVDQYMNPYIDMGNTAGGIAQNQYAQWVQDPYGAYNDIYSNYNASPWYDYESDQMQKAATSSAASGGYAGTEQDTTQQMATNQALMDKDFGNYMDYILGMQKSGVAGEQQMYNTGFQASNNALQGMTGYANASAGNQAMGVQNQNAMKNSAFGNLAQAGGMAAGLAML